MGPDMFPSFMAKDCKLVLVVPLLHIYNLVLKRKEFPECWKISRITPVFKKGNKNEILNYRPISLICSFAKIFEFILHTRVIQKVRLQHLCRIEKCLYSIEIHRILHKYIKLFFNVIAVAYLMTKYIHENLF
jgi:hypothetical protein